MLTLIGKKTHEKFLEIQKQLDKLSVSYQMKYTKDTPYIREGKMEFKGQEAIQKFIQDLDDELRRWHYCSV